MESNPEPIVIEGRKYCPYCLNEGIQVELTGSRQFLCKIHYSEFRREREKNRIRLKRKGFDIENLNGTYFKINVTKEKEYNTKIGTSDFGANLKRDNNHNPDFEKEARLVKRELNRITKRKTIGDYANRFAGNGNDSHLPESREIIINDLAYNEDFTGYIQYNSEGEIIDNWIAYQDEEDIIDVQDVDEFFAKNMQKPKSRKDIYRDWEIFTSATLFIGGKCIKCPLFHARDLDLSNEE